MRIIDWQAPESYELILFGDNQEGNVLSSKKGYRACIDYVCSRKNRFAVHMGDEMEAYWIDDPRYDPVILQSTPLQQQVQVIKDLTRPVKLKRLIAILYGNHSHRLYPKIGDITADTCSKLKINYGGFSCVVEFKDKHGIQFKGFFTHGRKLIRSIADDPVRREANEQLQLKQHLKNKMGDCLLMAKGHTHRLIVCDPMSQLYLTTEPEIKEHYTSNPSFHHTGFIHPDHRFYVNTGSFLKTFGDGVTSYSEMGEYDPIQIGYVVVTVEDRKIVSVEKRIL